MSLSAIEIDVIRAVASGEPERARAVAERHGWLEPGKAGLRKNRERDELEAKLVQLNLSIPWR
jgi:hypothetical protein